MHSAGSPESHQNYIGEGGAERLAGVLGQCTALAHLNLRINEIGPAGAQSLAGVLGQCAELAHLDLCQNSIGPDGAESLAGVLAQCPALAHLDLGFEASFEDTLSAPMTLTMSGKGGFERFVAWSSLWPCFVGTLHCLLFSICLADRQQEKATYCTHTEW